MFVSRNIVIISNVSFLLLFKTINEQVSLHGFKFMEALIFGSKHRKHYNFVTNNPPFGLITYLNIDDFLSAFDTQ